MIKQQLETLLHERLKASAEKLNLPTDNGAMDYLTVERPRQGNFGDYAVNVSPLAKVAKMPPPQIAAVVAEGLAQTEWTPTVVGSFINFQVSDDQLTQSLVKTALQEKPGQNTSLCDLRCLLEFVSANPTGPLHIGHGRWVALGDSIARILQHCGADVTREFYVNDAGSQMFNIANSLWYRCLELLETGGKLPEPEEGKPYPFYPGEYVVDLARTFVAQYRDKILAWDNPQHQAPEEATRTLAAYAQETILTQQRELMTHCRLEFDEWFFEKSLHESGFVQEIVETLRAKDVAYEKDGALWLASSRYGDDQDRVLIKSDGNYTYLTADIAYHENKFRRRNGYYNHFINIWGADHHGYIARMKAALEALGHDPNQLEILLGQLVNLMIDGERTRMGKRKKMLTLQDLVDEVGVDALRFWMVSKSQDTPLDFNVDLAKSQTDENPVFYIQYAHARCASIIRNAFSPRLDTLAKTELPPILTERDWQTFLQNLTPQSLAGLWPSLENDQARAALKELILKIDSFEDRVRDAARTRSPHIIARYSQDLAADFHRFYNVCRILLPDAEQTQRRLVIIVALKKVLAQSLDLLGVSAPEQM